MLVSVLALEDSIRPRIGQLVPFVVSAAASHQTAAPSSSIVTLPTSTLSLLAKALLYVHTIQCGCGTSEHHELAIYSYLGVNRSEQLHILAIHFGERVAPWVGHPLLKVNSPL